MRSLAIIFLLVCSTVCHAQPQWDKSKSLLIGVFRSQATVTGNKIVVSGGCNQAGSALEMIQIYDTQTDRWSFATDRLSVPILEHAQALLGDGRVLIAGGKTGNLTDSKTIRRVANCYVFDAANDKLHQVPDLPTVVGHVTANALPNGDAIVIGGRMAFVFDHKQEQWTSIKLRYSRRDHASVVLSDGRIAVVGGAGRKSMEVIDVTNNTSTLCPARLPESMDDLRIAPLPDGGVWIFGGQRTLTGDTVDNTWFMHPDDQELKDGPAMGVTHGASDQAITMIGPWVVIAGGESEYEHHDTELKTARIADTRSRKLFSLADLPAAHDDSVAATVGHTVYIIGGYRVAPTFGGLLTLPTATSDVWKMQIDPARLE